MPLFKRVLLTGLLAGSLSAPVLAQTNYISDEIRVPLRSGPGNQFRIIDAGLPSGTRLTVLEAKATDSFSKVRLADGQEGYLRSQYLQSNPSAKEKLNNLEKRYQNLREQSGAQSSELSQLKQRLKKSEQSEQQLSRSGRQLESELERIKAVSAESLALAERNEQLVKESLQLRQDKESLQMEKQKLESNQSQRWYLYGAGTVLSGVLLGLLLPMMQRRRKQSEWV